MTEYYTTGTIQWLLYKTWEEDRPLPDHVWVSWVPRTPTIREKVLNALSAQGQSYKELVRSTGGSLSSVQKALRDLERDGMAGREKVVRPTRKKHMQDFSHTPKVMWRLK